MFKFFFGFCTGLCFVPFASGFITGASETFKERLAEDAAKNT